MGAGAIRDGRARASATSAVAASGTAQPDGRRLRAERNREAVVDALLQLFDEGVAEPGAAEIAALAGVSERSVFRHFADLEALAAEAIARQYGRVQHLFAAPSVDGALDERIDALVRQRCRLYERMANLARVALQRAGRSATVAQAVAARRGLLRAQVEASFAPELAALGARQRRLLLASLDATCSLEALDHLRTTGGVGPRDLPVVLRATLSALAPSAAGDERPAGGRSRRHAAGRAPTGITHRRSAPGA